METRKVLLLIITIVFSANVFSQAPDWDWAKAFNGGTSSNEDGECTIAVGSSGNVYTIGRFNGTVDFNPGPGVYNLTSGSGWDMFISKLDNSGNFLWAKKIGGTSSYIDFGFSLYIDTVGGERIYIAGDFLGTVDFDPNVGTFLLTSSVYNGFLCKLDSSANLLWVKSWGGSSTVFCSSLSLDAFGDVYTAGTFSGTVDFNPGAGIFNLSAPGGKMYISKFSSNGNFLNAIAFGGTSGGPIVTDAFGNIYMAGSFWGTADFDPNGGYYLNSNGSYDMFVLKLDSSLNLLWAKSEGGTEQDAILSLALDAFGNVYTTGFYQDTVDFDPGSGTYNLISNGNPDIFIFKLDSSGNFGWAKGIGSAGGEIGYSISTDALNNVYTTGFFRDTADFDPGPGIFNLMGEDGGNLFISKLDASGNFVWAKSVDGTTYESGYSLFIDTAGNLYVTGIFEDSTVAFGSITLTNTSNTANVFVAKLNPNCIAPSLTTNSISPLCYGGIGSASVAASGGTPPYSYLWSNNDTTGVITGIIAGTYTVTVTSNANCTSAYTTATVTLTQPPQLVDSVSSYASDSTCIGSAVINVGGGTPPFQYQWSNSGNTSTINNLCSGWYYITVTDAHDCQLTDSVFVPLNTGINDNISQSIFISPNPMTSELRIQNVELRIGEIEIYNTVGEKILSQWSAANSQRQIKIDVSHFIPGLYFITITDQAGNKVTKKVVKM